MSCPVAAVVVAYESAEVLPRCLAALEGRVAEAVVIDNSRARSGSPELRARHGWVRWIDSASNLGFAGAVNRGVAATSEPFVLLLNPDCELRTGLEALVVACRREGVAGAGGLLAAPGGDPQVGFNARSLPDPQALAFEALGINRLWPRNPVNLRYRLLDLDLGGEAEVGQPAGAFLLLRRDALETVGGMDAGFHPVWFEDVDLCRRLRDAGLALRYVPFAAASHAGGHAVSRLPLQARLRAWYGGMLRYANKHFARGAYRRVRLAVLTGLALRALRSRVRGEPSEALGAYVAAFRILRLEYSRRAGPW